MWLQIYTLGICGLLLFGCDSVRMTNIVQADQSAPPVLATNRVWIDRSSPKALALSYHRALQSRNYESLRECYTPEWQAKIAPVTREAGRAWSEIRALEEAIAAKIGKREAQRFITQEENSIPFFLSPLGQTVTLDGRVADKIEWLVKGDVAIASDRGDVTFRAVRIKNQWWAVLDENCPSVQAFGPAATAFLRKLGAEARAVSQQIREGRITKDNYYEDLIGHEDEQGRMLARVPYGAPVDGVRICIFAAPWPPRFKKGERLVFAIRVKYEAQDGAPYWWAPAALSGLGKNVTVHVDGKPVVCRDDGECVLTGGGYMSGWSITLPDDLVLSVGSHKIRYELVSDGGTYIDSEGKSYRLVNGRLVSNELQFEIQIWGHHERRDKPAWSRE